MNIIIEGSQDMELLSLEDLEKLIPSTLNGKALNYGQGEGQVEIDGAIWESIVEEKKIIFCNMKKGS